MGCATCMHSAEALTSVYSAADAQGCSHLAGRSCVGICVFSARLGCSCVQALTLTDTRMTFIDFGIASDTYQSPYGPTCM